MPSWFLLLKKQRAGQHALHQHASHVCVVNLQQQLLMGLVINTGRLERAR
jgi:hypothetical protein